MMMMMIITDDNTGNDDDDDDDDYENDNGDDDDIKMKTMMMMMMMMIMMMIMITMMMLMMISAMCGSNLANRILFQECADRKAKYGKRDSAQQGKLSNLYFPILTRTSHKRPPVQKGVKNSYSTHAVDWYELYVTC